MPYKPINGITTATAQTNDQRRQTNQSFGGTLGINGSYSGEIYKSTNLFDNPETGDIKLFSTSYDELAKSLLTELYTQYDAANDQLNPDFGSSSDTLSYMGLRDDAQNSFKTGVNVKVDDRPYYFGPNIKVNNDDIDQEGLFSRVPSIYDKSGNNRGFGSNEKNFVQGSEDIIGNYLNT